MEKIPQMQIIAHLENAFETKFGVPRQSGLTEARGQIVFTPPYRNADALRGIEGFSDLWLIWLFSEAVRDGWSPTVRPPRLGGNTRMGVFATRSPFRPNAIGLSCVHLDRVEYTAPRGPVLHVTGADLMNGTPILDIKPYLPYTDSRPDAVGGFADTVLGDPLTVDFPDALRALVPAEHLPVLDSILRQDPRPHYQNDPERIYGFPYAGMEIRFTVCDAVLHVVEILPERSAR